ncbi:MAG: DNA repair protein RecO [Spirochaeta sp.]|nr:DNA repair protein RecO [Spirochaeta sp.]
MNRSSQQSAIVIRISPFGEHHAMVDLLTAEAGLLPAVAYGIRSRRSSLRGKVVPFARGTAWLYRDPRQDRSKITDFDVERYALNISADLDAYYEASLWAEVVWRSHASGEVGDEVFQLIATALTLLDDDPSGAGVLGTIVLWRYLGVMGLQPDPREMPELDHVEAEFLLRASRPDLSLQEVRVAVPPPSAERRARRLVIAAIQDAISVPLNALKVSAGLRGITG